MEAATSAAAAWLPSPSSEEVATAAALLLLSEASIATPPPPTSPLIVIPCDEISSSSNGSEVDLSSCISDSSSSASDLHSADPIRADPLQILALAAWCHELKPKIATNNTFLEILHKQSGIVEESEKKKWCQSDSVCFYPGIGAHEEEQDEAVSSLSSTSSNTARSGAGSVHLGAEIKGVRNMASVLPRKRSPYAPWKAESKHRATSSMRNRAAAIIDFLYKYGASTSEIRIRDAVGNSPDTSKALRMLLKLDKVKRSGAGGRADPFTYTVVELDGDY